MAKVSRHSSSKSKTNRRPRANDRVEIPGDTNYLFAVFPTPATETRMKRSERLHGTTLRHAPTPGNQRAGNTYQEGPGKGKGKIAGSTVHGGGNYSMRHKYQARIQNDLRKSYMARDSIGGSYNRSGHGTHLGDVSTHNPPDYR